MARSRSAAAAEPDRQRRDAPAMRELGDDEEDRQEVDEPERAERLPERFEIEPCACRRRRGSCSEARRLERELDRGPQQVEIDEMHDLAVEIGAPVAVDDLRQEQARDQEEVRHPERLGEGDDGVQPAFAVRAPARRRAWNASSPRSRCRSPWRSRPNRRVAGLTAAAGGHRRPISVLICLIYGCRRCRSPLPIQRECQGPR